ncbi:MAG: hypothetical protein LPD71_12380 [Shewanella sp.]|nr:hypothetical protein [Shewanella sp.]MCF1431384.1 hypothetical protein [Shewanella sp.]MCF1439499.1 hypothetical protein [Shewanella sp.]MCF1458279.1 hypothetical protein [Shewanella sp.]
MSNPLKYPSFCMRFQLDYDCAETRRLYRVYRKHLGVFNWAISELVVREALQRARQGV